MSSDPKPAVKHSLTAQPVSSTYKFCVFVKYVDQQEFEVYQ